MFYNSLLVINLGFSKFQESVANPTFVTLSSMYYWMKDILLHGDCLQLMNDIPDNSIDMVLCDLPYGVLNKGNKGAKWDYVIPFEPLWTQYKRICKEHAAIILFGGWHFHSKTYAEPAKVMAV